MKLVNTNKQERYFNTYRRIHKTWNIY